MKVTTTPNVREAIRSDATLAALVDVVRDDPMDGYLHLNRSHRTGPFDAIYSTTAGERYEARDRRLDVAMHAALSKARAAA